MASCTNHARAHTSRLSCFIHDTQESQHPPVLFSQHRILGPSIHLPTENGNYASFTRHGARRSSTSPFSQRAAMWSPAVVVSKLERSNPLAVPCLSHPAMVYVQPNLSPFYRPCLARIRAKYSARVARHVHGKTHSSIDCVRTGSTGRGLRRAYSCAQCAVGPHTSSAGGVGGQGGSTRPRVAPGRRRSGQSFRACRRAGRRFAVA